MNTATAIRPIEHPARIGKQNRPLLDSLAIAYRAALALDSDGFTVIDVVVGRDQPMLVIKDCHDITKLGAASVSSRSGPLGMDLIMKANVHDALVYWRVVEGA